MLAGIRMQTRMTDSRFGAELVLGPVLDARQRQNEHNGSGDDRAEAEAQREGYGDLKHGPCLSAPVLVAALLLAARP